MTSDLITSLSKLDAPDREVDAQIYIHFVEPTWHTSHKDPGAVAANKNAFWPEGKLRYITSTSRRAPLYTASVDAAIALAARVLPGWTFEHIGQDYIRARGLENDVMPMGWTVEISDGSQTIQGQAPTFPLAICIALLRAKEASKL